MKKIFIPLFFAFFFAHAQQPNQLPVNIILMVGDGMGLSQISAGMYANNNYTALEGFDYVGLSKTHAFKNLVTDSAASGTAIACGEKTFNGKIGIDSQNNELISILEICKKKGYLTGLVATSSIVHATPASFYAKVNSRSLYQDIALQLSQSEVDYFIGGGEKHFINRKDKRNLIDEMVDFEFVESASAFKNSTSDKIGYFIYSDEPPSIIDGRKPQLDILLSATLEKFDARKKPFFLLVEGSQIDWGGHKNDINYITSEFTEFDKAVKVALNYADNNKNTLVIVTADHETGGLAITLGRTDSFDYRADFNTLGHSATMVPVFGHGKNAAMFSGIYDNTRIFHKMKEALEKN